MSIWEFFIYFTLFIGLFVSIFYFILMFLDDHKIPTSKKKLKVSVIIPFWNEGSAKGERLRKTIDSLFACDYPKDKLEIILVNDGSTDNSLEIANSYLKKGVKVYSHKKSQGKTSAVNTGLKKATGELIVALDADSFIMPDVLDKLVPYFANEKVMAVIPSIKIWKPKTFLQLVQSHEFLSAVLIRYFQSKLGSIPLAPGAFTLIRKDFLDKYGSLDKHTMVEDLEMSMRIQSEKYLIENVVDANVYTSGVTTFKAFLNQRLRWFCGFIIQMKRYKHMFSKDYGNLGIFILPSAVVFILITVFIFMYGIFKFFSNFSSNISRFLMSGFDMFNFDWFDFNWFYLTLSNYTALPILLLIISFLFAYYIKKKSKEKQSIVLPFFAFVISYWLIGSLCWVMAIYYYIKKKKIKWGPNYFNS